MNIRNKVKYGYMILIFFIFCIVLLNQFGTYYIKKNEDFSDQVFKLISIHDSMNMKINNLTFEKDLEKLKKIKKEFFEFEGEFEELEESLIKSQTHISENKNIKDLLSKLYVSEKEIDDIFEEIYELQIKNITLQNRFKHIYPKEYKLRKSLQKEIERINTLELVKRFSDIKYYGKETLYQYKDQKTLDKWLSKFDDMISYLKDQKLKSDFIEYKKLSKEVAQIAIRQSLIEKEKLSLIKKLEVVLKSNKERSFKIEDELVKMNHQFLDNIQFYQVIISLIIVFFAFFISRLISLKLSTIIDSLTKGVNALKKSKYDEPIDIDDNEFGNVASAFNSMAKSIKLHQETLEKKIQERTYDLSLAKKEIESAHKHTQDSIEYASLIQHSLIPENQLFKKYFKDSFTLWQPKDIVGGDIYLFEELRDEDECLLLVIDCTGHGVPGAFVTMLVKAIERQVISKINHNKDEEVSPSKILSIFNNSIKHLLKQEDDASISNAGFDGGVIYLNKKENILKFSGANTPLFYIKDGELQTIKGSRHSVGYKKSDKNYEFKEHTISLEEGMKFYITTDGYLDQNGGEKDFPFGKKRFSSIINTNHQKAFEDQKSIFINELNSYQDKTDRNDDVTLIGFEI